MMPKVIALYLGEQLEKLIRWIRGIKWNIKLDTQSNDEAEEPVPVTEGWV
jgi:hypothetical protein